MVVIAIDGPSGTGKSTVAKAVAKKLGVTFFDTGAMYRAFAWKVLKEGIALQEESKIKTLLEDFPFTIRTDREGEKGYFVGKEEVTKAIREPQVTSAASKIATYPTVRKALVKIQRKVASECSAVFEGRDMGTVVFPKADLKIFLTAKPKVRAERRYLELQTKFPDLASSLSAEKILEEMQERDQTDQLRSCSPLKQAEDAICIDTSEKTIAEVVELIVQEAQKVAPSYPKKGWFYGMVYYLVKLFLRCFYRLEIQGLEHFRPGKGVIVGNHVSNFDPPVLSVSCPEEVHFIAKASLFRNRFFSWIIRKLHAHPVSRGQKDAHVFRELFSVLKEGKKVLLFPEGARSKDGKLSSLSKGVSFLVEQTESTIFPCYIQGTYDIWPVNRRLPKLGGKIRCTFGVPIEWNTFSVLPKEERSEVILRETLKALEHLEKQAEI